MYFSRYILYVIQDLKVKKNLVIFIMGFVALLMIVATVPGNSKVLLEWHSTRDFVLLFRFEFLHVPTFLILLGSIFRVNDWLIIRRYKNREQLGTNKLFLVIIISGLFSIVVMILGIICTSIVKFIIYPNIINYTSLFLYVPVTSQKNSFVYFACIYFLITTVLGLIFILLTDIIKNKILSAIILITFVILDRFTLAIIPYFLYASETVSPSGTFLIFLCLLIILINAVHIESNNKNYFAHDENI